MAKNKMRFDVNYRERVVICYHSCRNDIASQAQVCHNKHSEIGKNAAAVKEMRFL